MWPGFSFSQFKPLPAVICEALTAVLPMPPQRKKRPADGVTLHPLADWPSRTIPIPIHLLKHGLLQIFQLQKRLLLNVFMQAVPMGIHGDDGGEAFDL
jgi:hypothetical protein